MGAFSKWLLHDDQKYFFDLLFAVIANLIFLGLVTVIFLAAGRGSFALLIFRGFCLLWAATLITHFFLVRIHEVFRINIYDHGNAFLISNLFVSCALQAGWAIFAALIAHRFSSAASVGMTVVMYVIGFVSCLISFYAVSSFFPGHFYRFVSLPLAIVMFIAASIWVWW